MKVVLTVQLQQDNGTPVFTGTQTKNNFADSNVAGSIQADSDLARSFLVGFAMQCLIREMAWIANGVFPTPAAPVTVTISQLGN